MSYLGILVLTVCAFEAGLLYHTCSGTSRAATSLLERALILTVVILFFVVIWDIQRARQFVLNSSLRNDIE